MKYVFGNTSTQNLITSSHQLQEITNRVLSYGIMDFSVIEGYRSTKDQYKLYTSGMSLIDGYSKKSKHNYVPSRAIDLLPYPKIVNGIDVWKDFQRFSVLAGLMYAASKELNYPIRWGGDWDMDGNNKDSTLHDMPHFELV